MDSAGTAPRVRKNGPVKRNLEPFKEEIRLMTEAGLSPNEISMHLFDTHKIQFSRNVVVSRQREWGFRDEAVVGASKIKGNKRNLEPFKIQLLNWKNEGLTSAEMEARFDTTFGSHAPASTIQRFLDRWDKPVDLSWREIETLPLENIHSHQPRPINLLSQTELRDLQRGIRTAYRKSPTPPDSNPISGWMHSLVRAACYDQTIQGIMVKEWLQPGLHWSTSRLFDPLWIDGIQLLGSYTFDMVDTREKILEGVNSMTPRILEKVMFTLKEFLEEGVSLTEAEHGNGYLEAAMSLRAATTPPKCVVDLLRLTRDELIELKDDFHLSKTMDRLSLRNLPASETVFQYLKKERKNSSLTKTITREVTESLKSWLPAGMVLGQSLALKPSDMELVERKYENCQPRKQKNKRRGKERDQQNQEGFESGSDGDSEKADDRCDGDDSEVNYQGQEYGRLYTLLAQRVRSNLPVQPMVYGDWREPITGALLGYPPPRFGMASWEPSPLVMSFLGTGPDADKEMTQPSRSFSNARKLSFTESEPSFSPDRRTTLAEAVDYLKKIVTLQTTKEREEYEAICLRMSACTSRPAISEVNPGSLNMWSRKDRDDDWWHCRQLLQMLFQRYSIAEQEVQTLTTKLLTTLAAIEGGSTEAVIWFIALDGVLDEISQSVRQQDAGEFSEGFREVRVQDELLRELTMFAHSVAAHSIALRFHWRSPLTKANRPSPSPSILQRWYTMAFLLNPRCSNPNCLCLLPDPRFLEGDMLRQLISVGTNDSRSGTPRARSFISTNRKVIFPCLVTWLRDRDPQLALCCVLYWLAGVYHTDSSCKACRGKLWRRF